MLAAGGEIQTNCNHDGDGKVEGGVVSQIDVAADMDSIKSAAGRAYRWFGRTE